MKNRVVHVDIAKGVSIVLVALYHSKVKEFFPEVMQAMSLFRMPLFFFLSGVFFSYVLAPKGFLLKKSDALLKPYFFILSLVFIVSVFINDESNLWQLKGMLYGTGETIRWVPMWFLPHLFVVYVFSYILFHIIKLNKLSIYFKWLCIFLFLLIGTFNLDFFWGLKLSIFDHSILLPGLPFSVDIVLVTSFYFIGGYLLKESIIKFIPNLFLFWASFTIFSSICIFTNAHIDLNNRFYVNPLAAILASICGIYLIIFISFYMAHIKKLKNMFTIFGKASLFILIFHLPINQVIYNEFKEAALEYNLSFLLAFTAFILSLLIPLIIKWMVNQNRLLTLFVIPLNSNKSLKGKN